MLHHHHPWRRRLLAANLVLLFAAATFCRAFALDHVPGLNGDEAWQGVQAQKWLRGEPISWRTPTGNPINPLSFLPLAALHVWLPPSIVLLRLTALMSGLAALGVNYLLCRRVFDRQLAAISTVILAVLPATVAYSRFAWDTSQSVLVTLPVMYCALGAVREPARRRGWLIGAVAALCLAVLVHPTNVFAAPLIVSAAVWSWRRELAVSEGRVGCYWRLASARRFGLMFEGRVAAVAIMGTIALVLLFALAASRSTRVSAAAQRLVSPSQAASFSGRVVDLLSGTTIYRYIPGVQFRAAESATLGYRLAAWTITAAAGYGLWNYLRKRRRTVVRVLLVGLGTGLTAFYTVAGPQAIQPHFERYGMWMIAPSVLMLALGICWWMRRPETYARLRPAVALLLAWAVLAGFIWNYFRPLGSGGGETHVAFRTATVEPKLAALRVITSQAPSQPVEIVAHGWWVYWPLAYLAGSEPRLRIVPQDVPGETAQQLSDRRAWHVGFVDETGLVRGQSQHHSRAAKQHHSRSAKQQHSSVDKNWDSPRQTIVVDAANRPLLRIVPPVTAGAATGSAAD